MEQIIGSIRTVASFTGEKQAVAKYSRSLKSAYSSGVGVQESLARRCGHGHGHGAPFLWLLPGNLVRCQADPGEGIYWSTGDDCDIRRAYRLAVSFSAAFLINSVALFSVP
ncbi:hypothetical protein E2562_019967 [Oryza meyeriana var. granulata]|uniref:Uncharacterized protein n=1 Tax=Oryza meyeriana var. granulata TaxID=110450 RepID=A0A6G1CH54_9ORYZ|nr:hypothetical protein E2562_019967 [Oryza meyeriana var. granulata]